MSNVYGDSWPLFQVIYGHFRNLGQQTSHFGVIGAFVAIYTLLRALVAWQMRTKLTIQR